MNQSRIKWQFYRQNANQSINPKVVDLLDQPNSISLTNLYEILSY